MDGGISRDLLDCGDRSGTSVGGEAAMKYVLRRRASPKMPPWHDDDDDDDDCGGMLLLDIIDFLSSRGEEGYPPVVVVDDREGGGGVHCLPRGDGAISRASTTLRFRANPSLAVVAMRMLVPPPP